MQSEQSTAIGSSGVGRDIKIIAQASGVRIAEYTLHPGERHPWHHHTEVSDRFYCLQGRVGVETRDPPAQFRLHPGESCEVPAGTVHFASNAGSEPCRYLLIQALGKYDYIRAV
jgi:quercetin dioxygenase-like cupin family protein